MLPAAISTDSEPTNDAEPVLRPAVEIVRPLTLSSMETWEARERRTRPQREPPPDLVTPLQVAEWLAAPRDHERAFRCWARLMDSDVEPCDVATANATVKRLRSGESLPRRDVVAALLFVIRR